MSEMSDTDSGRRWSVQVDKRGDLVVAKMPYMDRAYIEVVDARVLDPSPSQRRIEAAVALADAALESDDLDKEAWASVSLWLDSRQGSSTLLRPQGDADGRNRRAEDHQRRLHVNSARLTTARDAYRAALAAEKGDAT